MGGRAAGHGTLPHPGRICPALLDLLRGRYAGGAFEEDTDEEEQESICRGWRFVQHFKSRYRPEFLLGWDIGRAAMLARWGCYLGWITEGEGCGYSVGAFTKAVQELHSWRELPGHTYLAA